MVNRDIAPETRILGVVPVVAHHPIIIHAESVFVSRNSIYKYLVILDCQYVMFVSGDASLVKRDVFRGYFHSDTFFGDDNRSEVINIPSEMVIIFVTSLTKACFPKFSAVVAFMFKINSFATGVLYPS